MKHLLNYINGLTEDERTDVASACGISVGHLKNIAYGLRRCPAEVAMGLERKSSGAVMRWHVCPNWRDIWDELQRHPDAPPIPAASTDPTSTQPNQPAETGQGVTQGVEA